MWKRHRTHHFGARQVRHREWLRHCCRIHRRLRLRRRIRRWLWCYVCRWHRRRLASRLAMHGFDVSECKDPDFLVWFAKKVSSI